MIFMNIRHVIPTILRNFLQVLYEFFKKAPKGGEKEANELRLDTYVKDLLN
jgi:hypothetical protein